MKNKSILLISMLALLASCGTGNNSSDPISSARESGYELNLSVVAPVGAPAVALYRHMGSRNLEIVGGDNIGTYLSAESNKAIVIAPTNAGVTAIQRNNAPYKLAANITFGNFYLAATGNDSNGTLDGDDYIVAFKHAAIPGKIFDYVYADKNFSDVEWKAEAADAKACLVSGIDSAHDNKKVDYVFIAEPAMSHALTLNSNASEKENIQSLFQAKSGKELIQASVFVHNDSEKSKVDAFLSSLKSDTEAFVADPSVIDPYVASLGEDFLKGKFSVPSTAFLKSITSGGKNRMGLGYKKASENKDAINAFLGLWNQSVNEATYYI